MKTAKKYFAAIMAVLMILMQVPLSVAAETAEKPYLTPATVENAKVGQRYGVYFSVKGYEGDNFQCCELKDEAGERVYTLPEGLEFKYNRTFKSCTISGIPKTAGTYKFTIEIWEYNNVVLASQPFTLVIEEADPLEITHNRYENAVVNREYNGGLTFYVNSAFTPKWSLSAGEGGQIPPGITIDETEGSLRGIPTTAGVYNFLVNVECGSQSTSKAVTAIVEPEGGCKHEAKRKIEGVKATCKNSGTANYYYCSGCDYNYLDEECKYTLGWHSPSDLYTTSYHTDKDKDGKCDECQANMPVFKKVTDANDITSCGMYLVVGEIADEASGETKYYTIKQPEERSMNPYLGGVLESCEITPNDDGTFSYFNTEENSILCRRGRT